VIRVGIGYDCHRFEPSGPLILGGIRIPFDQHLHGHSDGDAVCHALTDAVLGAAAAGDIGGMFPNDAPENKGRDSIEMLTVAVERVRAIGYKVEQCDITIVTEAPRLADHREFMQTRLAKALGIPRADVNVKAKTNEGMGWIGRGEGIACVAVATISPLT
jgi:2-C-methyl-D-erythritol 2,4-cyclodiphosphate synthase